VQAHETAAGKQTQGPPQVQENQSLLVRKKVHLGDSSPDALSQYSTLEASLKARLFQAYHICQGE